ncbi:MAG: thioredoxin family protein [Verrucomicrobiota bacterium]
MITFFKTAAIFIATASLALAGDWGTDWEAAKERAKKEDKPILINFTGTDWCGWCIKLENEVFSKQAFKDYAKDNLVLMEVDFPRKKKQSAKVKEQNKKLDKEFGIEGYPTIFLLDAEGKKVSDDIGYRKGGPEAYVKYLKELIAKAG